MENLINTSVVIASFERPKLLKQTIESIWKNSDNPVEIIVVDDFSSDPLVDEYLFSLSNEPDPLKKIKYFRYPFRAPIHAVKNKGFLMISEKSKYVHFSDNDIYYEQHWDTTLTKVLTDHPEIGIVGGQHHPHHQINKIDGNLIYSNEQPGFSMFMRVADFKNLGPWFSDQPVGGEDSNLCRMTELAGYKIAAVNPMAVVHCGASGSHGNRAADYPQIMRLTESRKDLYVE